MKVATDDRSLSQRPHASPRWRSSIRLRLALWHALSLTLILAAFFAGSFLFLKRATDQNIERALSETINSFVVVWASERDEEKVDAVEAARLAVREFKFRDARVLVFDGRGRLIALSDTIPLLPSLRIVRGQYAAATPFAGILARARGKAPVTEVSDDEKQVRVFAASTRFDGAPYTVVSLQDASVQSEQLSTFAEALMVAIPLALGLAGIGGYLLSRASLAPIVSMSAHADRISGSNLNERLSVINPHDELGQLAIVFNRLLSRVEEAFDRQKRFMADASHELRTPLAVIRGSADVALARETRSSDEYRQSLTVTRDAALRMSRIVEDLFTLARADADQYPVSRADIYLEEVIAAAVSAMRHVARPRQITLLYDASEQEAPYTGDPLLLQRLLTNLLDNAIKFTPDGGAVTVTLRCEERDYRIAVRDTGLGVPETARGRVFDRFFQADSSRTGSAVPEGNGAGLGLSIARWIAEAHGGTLELSETGPYGSTFVLTLPQPAA